MRRLQRRVAASLAIVFLFAACGERAAESTGNSGSGSAPNSPSEAKAPDACAVLTAQEIEEVLGVAAKIQPGDHLRTIATTSMCSYESSDAHNLVSVVIRAGPADLDAQTNLRQYLAGIKNNMGESYRIDPVGGLSAPAVWNPDMKQLTAFKSNTLIIVTMLDSRGKEPLEAAKALVEKGLPDIG